MSLSAKQDWIKHKGRWWGTKKIEKDSHHSCKLKLSPLRIGTEAENDRYFCGIGSLAIVSAGWDTFVCADFMAPNDQFQKLVFVQLGYGSPCENCFLGASVPCGWWLLSPPRDLRAPLAYAPHKLHIFPLGSLESDGIPSTWSKPNQNIS